MYGFPWLSSMLPPRTLSQVNHYSLLDGRLTLLELSLSYSSPRCMYSMDCLALCPSFNYFKFSTGFAPLLRPFAICAVIWSQAVKKGTIATSLKWPVHGRFIR